VTFSRFSFLSFNFVNEVHEEYIPLLLPGHDGNETLRVWLYLQQLVEADEQSLLISIISSFPPFFLKEFDGIFPFELSTILYSFLNSVS
jgi:hypothetical protein